MGEVLKIVIPGVLILAVVLIWYIPIIKRVCRRPVNTAEKKIFIGDMCTGVISTKGLSTTLTATADRLVLKGPLGKRYELGAESITQIEKGKLHIWFLNGMFFGSIQIRHSIKDCPEQLMFSAWRVKAEKLLEELGELGYRIGS